jgi:DNA-binding transcriptional regulator YiaG
MRAFKTTWFSKAARKAQIANAAPSDQQLALLIQNKELIEIGHVCQPVFARYLNTSESTVQKWESGAKRPSGMALKLLAVVEKHGLKVLA